MTAARLRLVALAVAVVAAASSCASADPAPTPPVERVLIVSTPGVTWDDVRTHDLPNLEALVSRSAIGDLSTRIGRGPTSNTAAYLTVGAGTRAVVPGVDMGVALNPDELHAGIPAPELLVRRLGREVSGIAYIPVGSTIDANETSPFGASPGLLGDELDAGGVRRMVVANADAAEGFPTDEPVPDGAFARSAATALMGSDGVVPEGSVGRGLLIDDPDAPFGRRLDHQAVLDVFDEGWSTPGPLVALVETSDLSRAASYASRSTPDQRDRLREAALAQSDDLLGQLLERVDPDRDAVVVVSPVSRTDLGIAAMATPTVTDGLLRSPSTRRDGYVYLADVAPTILELVGLEAPTSMEGRSFDVASATGDRVEHLADQASAAALRDARLPLVVVVVIGALVLLAAATARRDHLPPRVQGWLRPAAIAALGIAPGTFLATLVPATRTSLVAYLAVVVASVVVVGVVGAIVDRRWPGSGVLVGLGMFLLLIAADLLLGAPLQVNSIFGYSMAVAGRYTGLGNLAFALFASAAVCAAVVAFDRYGPRALVGIGLGLAAMVLLDGLPMLGADVGGVISMVPAFLVTLVVLSGREVRAKHLLVGVVAALAVVAVFGLIDSARPSASQTHLARIGEHLTQGRVGSVSTIIWRRLEASFGAGDGIVWMLALGIVAGALVQAWVAWHRGGVRSRQRSTGSASSLALVIGLATLASIGLVVNDSSIAVPATMLIIVVPVVVSRVLDPAPGASDEAVAP